jgi:hypothetical protein
MTDIKCPFFNNKQNFPIKKWKYSSTMVSRFQCKCGKFFNFYKGKKSNWTIPKSKNS